MVAQRVRRDVHLGSDPGGVVALVQPVEHLELAAGEGGRVRPAQVAEQAAEHRRVERRLPSCHGADAGQQLVQGLLLGQVAGCPRLDGPGGVAPVAAGRQHHDLRARGDREQLRDHVGGVGGVEPEVEQHDIGVQPRGGGHGVGRRAGGAHDVEVELAGDGAREAVEQYPVVVDEQDPHGVGWGVGRWLRHASSMRPDR